ncbi:MAG: hypothetical protein KKC69_07230 [Acidobacteria bacterium]|nr:hypothetical protein [Acidobacteriota bacterium]
MVGEKAVPCVYFDKAGKHNTRRTLEITAERARDRGIETILVATTSGETGLLASRMFMGKNCVVVTHSTGFWKPDVQQVPDDVMRQIRENGARILTCQHAFGGVGRAVRRKLGTYELEELIAFTLRTFGQGMKVAVEIALMAADAGLVKTGTPCVSIGGTGEGADTAVLLLPVNAQDFFDIRILEIWAKPEMCG